MYVVKFSKIYFLGFKHRSFQGIFFSEIVQFLKIFVLVTEQLVSVRRNTRNAGQYHPRAIIQM